MPAIRQVNAVVTTTAAARPFTMADTTAIVDRIGSDLALVVQAVRDADPHLRALVLTGGFARGEGAVLDGAPQNDYDFVAVRGPGRPKVPYDRVRRALEAKIGLHIDLAAVPSWRLRWVAPSIFWYETALRGRVLWGQANVLDRVQVRTPEDLDRREGLRLLVNRAAGLLLVSGSTDDHALRLQAAKALLAAADAKLLATGRFAPSQRERWSLVLAMREAGTAPRILEPRGGWLHWAFGFKVDPGNAEPRAGAAAWKAARRAILTAVPAALEHAGLDSIEQYGRQDGLIDSFVYYRRSAAIPRARRLARHPTSRVRVATLRMLEACPDGAAPDAFAARCLAPLAAPGNEPLRVLDALRHATLQ